MRRSSEDAIHIRGDLGLLGGGQVVLGRKVEGEQEKDSRERGATQARQTMVWHHGDVYTTQDRTEESGSGLRRLLARVQQFLCGFGSATDGFAQPVLGYCSIFRCSIGAAQCVAPENDADVSVAMIADLAVVYEDRCVGFVVSESGLLREKTSRSSQ